MNKKLNFLLCILWVSFSSYGSGPQIEQLEEQRDQDQTFKKVPSEPSESQQFNSILEKLATDEVFRNSYLKANPQLLPLFSAVGKEAEKIQAPQAAQEEDKKYQRARRFHNTMLATLRKPESQISYINAEEGPNGNNSFLRYTPVYSSSYSETECDNKTDFDNPIFVPTEGKQIHQETLMNSDQDTRVSVTHPYRWPYSICGKLLIDFKKKGNIVGSGTLISPIHVLTAGHCILDRVNGYGLATSIRFFYPVVCPNEHAISSTEWKQINVKEAYIVTGWSKNGRPECDYGVIVLEDKVDNVHIPLGNQFGFNEALNLSATNQDNYRLFELSVRETLSKEWVNIAGFPLNHGPCKEREKVTEVNTHELHETYTAYGKLMPNIKKSDLLSHKVDTTEGQSGSLVYSVKLKNDGSYYHGIGIHTQGFDKKINNSDKNHKRRNKAVMLTPIHLSNIVQWISLGDISEGQQ
ncbi:hypothetical protein IM40_10645 (plasmid) [Candidatus Paracaedimonas acanthamoebae]|nr:hypothetical protein IM40_10645 [Candidatus Paracaedimonas acanthamoebae]